MTPSPSGYDIWTEYPPNSRVQVNCLMPNGIFIPLEVPSDAVLSDIKYELWEEARKYPLEWLLKEHSLYNFMCINSMAEKEELVNEARRLCDIKPFGSFLKVVEREGDKAEQILNAQIGHLIGKGLHDFDALKSLEVNEFRWRMKMMVLKISQEKEKISILDKIKNQFPSDIAESDDLPSYLEPKLQDGNMVVGIRVKRDENNVGYRQPIKEDNMNFSFSIAHTTTPLQLLTIALQKKATLVGKYPIEPDIAQGYVLKLCGRQEYLIGDYPLSRFLCVRDLLTKEIFPSFIVVPIEKVLSNTEAPNAVLQDLEDKKGSRVSLSVPRKKAASVSSWRIDAFFSFHVDAVSQLSYGDSDVGIQAGIFHGGRSLCEPRKTAPKHCTEGECTLNEELTFDLKVKDIPRTARLCIVVYTLSKMAKGSKHRRVKDIEHEMYINPVAWVNMAIFDYTSVLKSGSFTLYMWTYAEDVQNDEVMNPLGTVVSNPNVEHATSLTVTFPKYDASSVVYPSMVAIEEEAAQIQRESSELQPDQFALPLNGDANSSGRLDARESMSYISEQLRFTAERDPLHEIHEQEKKLLWNMRYKITQTVPNLLPKLLLCIEWNNHKETMEMLSLLNNWPKLPPARALELLDFAYADSAVRSYAVNCIRGVSDDELLLYLLQLVQALKHESHLQCDLVDFLIIRALNNRKIGHFLFWHLRSEMHMPAVAVRFGLMLEAYCRGAPDHMIILSRQVEALNKLKETNEIARQKSDGREKLKLFVQESLKETHCAEALSNLLCPLDPSLCCMDVQIEKCKTMESKMKPLWVVFGNEDPFGSDIYFIFKHGDDLRQDMLTLQMIRIMDRLWKQSGLDLRMNPYGCISTGNRVGLIEIVLNADTLANIQKEKSGSNLLSAFRKPALLEWLKDHNPTDAALNMAIEEFSLSCAGYCVATYVLGVADRHSDNIMMKKNGQLFHIDFGHILGHFKEKFGIRRERVPFVLTDSFEYVITHGQGKKGSNKFEKFQGICEQAFLILRRNGSFIISLFAMMISTGLPELSSEKDLNYLRETMVLDLSEQEALRHFRSKFEEAKKNSWKTSLDWAAHNIAKNNKQ